MITQTKILLLLLLLFLILLQSCATLSQDSLHFQNRIDSLLTSDFFKSSQAAISVYNLTENKSLYQHNEKILLRPASNQKILTTAAAYLFLGADYNFKTTLYHTGEIEDSVCKGDIYIAGGLDPDFTSRDLDSLVREIKNFGIKEIHGNLYADVSTMDSLFWGKGWMWDDDPAPFAAYLSPLNINKNSIRIGYKPAETGSPAEIELIPQTNFFQIKNSSVTIDTGKTTLTITRDWLNRNNTIQIEGSISKLAKHDTILLNVFNPAYYFLGLMKESFERNGISFKGNTDTLTLRVNSKKIFSLEHNIEPIITNTNKTSDNLSAEMILRALALKSSNKSASAKNGILFIDSLITLAGLNAENYYIADGSGLSFYNLLSAELLMEILKYLYFKQPELFVKFFNTLPISGYDGTLSNRMKESPAYKRVHAKTGTLRGASSLSGYLQSKKGHLIAFSILIQNYVGSANQARELQDKICEMLFETN
ncbi:MAG: D-alanyl-D-alanine carboxypeptidase/D-alanyl-D-alanine-endopeptidase [Bacteroidota bacterium]